MTATTLPSDAKISATPIHAPRRSEQADRGRPNIAAHRTGAPVVAIPADQMTSDARRRSVGGEQTPAGAAEGEPHPIECAPRLLDPTLLTFSALLDNLERVRIATENRVRQLTRDEPDKDGHVRGFCLDENDPQVASLVAQADALAKLEHQAVLDLQRAMRKHPLGPWVKATAGVGEKQGARMLAAVGDPYWNSLHDRPRTVSELWAYCGMHTVEGVAARHRKGQRSNWNATAKMRAYLVATSCIKVPASPYRAVYDARRAHTAITHPDWTPGHSHNDALRVVAKEVLKDLWTESKRLYEAGAGR